MGMMPYMLTDNSWQLNSTKKDTGKSMKSAFYVLGMPKGTSWAEVTSNSAKIKPVSLAIIK